MIKRTYNNGFKIKYYPSLDEGFYLMLLRDLKRLEIEPSYEKIKKESCRNQSADLELNN